MDLKISNDELKKYKIDLKKCNDENFILYIILIILIIYGVCISLTLLYMLLKNSL